MNFNELVLSNEDLTVKVLSYGGIITHFSKKSDNINITLAFNDYNDYIINDGYLGAMIGPLAGRTAFGKFKVNDIDYEIDINAAPHNLHGGIAGFHAQTFEVEKHTQDTLILIKDIDYTLNGYPAFLKVSIKYHLENNHLIITNSAIPSKPMPINITNHMYFNLDQSISIENHAIQMDSNRVVYVADHGANSKQVMDVKGTVFDLQEKLKLSTVLKGHHEQFNLTRQLDHTYLLEPGAKLHLYNNDDSKELIIQSTSQAIQLYLANYFEGKYIGHNGLPMEQHAAIAIEPQDVPNAIN